MPLLKVEVAAEVRRMEPPVTVSPFDEPSPRALIPPANVDEPTLVTERAPAKVEDAVPSEASEPPSWRPPLIVEVAVPCTRSVDVEVSWPTVVVPAKTV